MTPTQEAVKKALAPEIKMQVLPTLANRAGRARLSFTSWTPERVSKVVKTAADKELGATKTEQKDWTKGGKVLIRPEHLEPMRRLMSEARAYHRAHSLPWYSADDRILLTKTYQATWKRAMIDFEARHATERAHIAQEQQNWIDEAQRDMPPGLFDASAYPADISARFTMSHSFEPLTKPDQVIDDWRLARDQDSIDLIVQTMQEGSEQALETACQDIMTRFTETVGKMRDDLRAFDPNGKGKERGIFRDSLIENVRGLADLLPMLNVLGDPRLDDIADRMRQELCAVDADDLRDSPMECHSIANAADDILAAMKGVWA